MPNKGELNERRNKMKKLEKIGKNYILKHEELFVDAGNISVLNLCEIKKNYGIREDFKSREIFKLNKHAAIVSLPTGNYILKCGNDEELTLIDKGNDFTVLEDENLYIGDACYIVKDWDKYLDDTDYLKKSSKNCIHYNTGGDGEFKSIFIFTPK